MSQNFILVYTDNTVKIGIFFERKIDKKVLKLRRRRKNNKNADKYARKMHIWGGGLAFFIGIPSARCAIFTKRPVFL